MLNSVERRKQFQINSGWHSDATLFEYSVGDFELIDWSLNREQRPVRWDARL